MPTTFSVEFNWSGDGSTWADESAYLVSARLNSGLPPGGPLPGPVAEVGTCVLTLNNASRRFSPDNSAGALYGNLVPRRAMRIRVTDGLTTWTVFRGQIDRIEPQAGPHSRRQVTITCVDAMAVLANQRISLPLQHNKRSDELIRALVNVAYGAPGAAGTITLTGNPANNDTVTVNGVTYTFKTALTPTPGEVLIGARSEDTAANLVAAMTGSSGAGTLYASATSRAPGVLADYLRDLPGRATVWFNDMNPNPGCSVAPIVSAGVPYCGYGDFFPRSVGSSGTWSVFLQPGTYSFFVLGFSGPNLGKIDWALDGLTFLSGQDWYSGAYVVLTQSGSLSVAEGGHHVLRMTISGKNPSSSDYVCAGVKAWFRQGVD